MVRAFRSSSARPRRRTAVALGWSLAGVLAVACGADPVAWDEAAERRLPPPPISAESGAPNEAADALVQHTVAELAVGAAPRPAAPVPDGALPVRLAVVETTTTLPLPPDPAGARCPQSLRMADAPAPSVRPPAGDPHAAHRGAGHAAPAPNDSGADGRAAVWWARRPDGSAALYLSRSADGGRTWGAPLAVDTLDRSDAGCERPAPSLAVDMRNGYLHVAYSMRAPEGQGVFYAHQMDPRGPFERPQVIVYGDRPAATSVSSDGDRVVVAYEDPNTGGRPFVSLALSRTAGHSWAERLPVSESNVAAERPVVALGGTRVVLGWVERAAPRQLTTTDDPRAAVTALPTGVVVRVGRLRE